MGRYRQQKNMLFLTALSLLLGVMMITAVNTNHAGEAKEDYELQETIAYIESLEEESATLQEQIQATREQISAIQNERAAGESELADLMVELEQLRAYAGLTELVGPGLVITMDDNTVGAELAQKNNPSSYNASNYIIHDKDLRYTLRELAPYSEAVAINGIRIIDTTSIRCVGTTVYINATRESPPYVIQVIGDPDQLELALQNSARYQALIRAAMPITVSRSQEITVPAYTGVISPKYSSLLQDETSASQQGTNY